MATYLAHGPLPCMIQAYDDEAAAELWSFSCSLHLGLLASTAFLPAALPVTPSANPASTGNLGTDRVHRVCMWHLQGFGQLQFKPGAYLKDVERNL